MLCVGTYVPGRSASFVEATRSVENRRSHAERGNERTLRHRRVKNPGMATYSIRGLVTGFSQVDRESDGHQRERGREYEPVSATCFHRMHADRAHNDDASQSEPTSESVRRVSMTYSRDDHSHNRHNENKDGDSKNDEVSVR